MGMRPFPGCLVYNLKSNICEGFSGLCVNTCCVNIGQSIGIDWASVDH